MTEPRECPYCAQPFESRAPVLCPTCGRVLGPSRLAAWLVPEETTRASQLAGFFLLLSAALAAVCWLPGPGSRHGSEAAWWTALVDFYLGAKLVTGRRWARALALGRALFGAWVVARMLHGTLEPATFTLQLALLAALVLLLLGAPERGRFRWGAGLGGTALAVLAVLVSARFTQSSPLNEPLLALQGALEPGTVRDGVGEDLPYRLSFPATGWRQARPAFAQARFGQADRVWLLPSRDAWVAVEVVHLPNAGDVDLNAMFKGMRDAREKLGNTEFQVLETQPLEGSFDAASMQHLRERGQGWQLESRTTLYVRGDRLLAVYAVAPAHRFEGLDGELKDILASFTYEPPRPPRLPLAALERVRRATVKVGLSSDAFSSSGSGFFVHSAGNETYIVTNNHVLHPLGEAPNVPKQALLVRDGVRILAEDAEGHRELLTAREVKSDAAHDLALLKLTAGRTVPALPLVHCATLPERTPLFVAGYPFGYRMRVQGDREIYPRVAINGGWLGREELESLRQKGQRLVDVGINPGNSGGPVVDAEGRLMGVAVAHVRGSEVSMMITSETLADFIASVEPRPFQPTFEARATPAPPVPDEPLPPSAEARVRAATVLVRSKLGATAGVVVGRDAQRLWVVANVEVLGTEWKPDTPLPTLTVRARPDQLDAPLLPAKVLRYSRTAGLVLLSVPPREGVEPLEPSEPGRQLMGGAISVLSFRRDASEKFNPVPRLMHGSISSVRRDFWEDLQLLQLDVGINRGQSGGPVVDPEGRLMGLVVSRAAHTNVTLALPIERITDFLQGGLAGGHFRAVRDEEGRCAIQALALVEDPLGRQKAIRLRMGPEDTSRWGSSEPYLRHMGALGDVVAEAALPGHDTSLVLTAEVPCVVIPQRVQLEIFDGQDVLRTSAALVETETGQPGVLMGHIDGTFQAGGDPPDVLDFVLSRMAPPASWELRCVEADRKSGCERECQEGQRSSCTRLGRWWLRKSRPHEAVRAFARGCALQDVESCIEWGLQVNHAGAPPDQRSDEDLLFKLCDRNYERACDARMPDRQEEERVSAAQGCASGEGQGGRCVELGFIRLRSPGGMRDNALQAAQAFEQACDAGNNDGCNWLARLGMDGWGVPFHADASVQALERGCRQAGHAPSCVTLAAIYGQGFGVSKDLNEARKLLLLSCQMTGGCELEVPPRPPIFELSP